MEDNNNLRSSVEGQDTAKIQNLLSGGEDKSRFSRRKFIQTGVVASPLLMSVKSPMAWGCGTNTNGSIGTRVSGNASTTGGCGSLPCFDPKSWCDILKQLKYHDTYVILLKLLKYAGIDAHSSFNYVFFRKCFSWQYSYDRKMKYKFVYDRCEDTSFVNALDDFSFGSPKLALRVCDMSRRSKKYYNVNINLTDFFRNITCGYLNSICSPHAIQSDFDHRDIQRAVNECVYQTSKSVVRNRGKGNPDCGSFDQLSTTIASSWRYSWNSRSPWRS